MVPVTRRQVALEELVTRLGYIQIEKGYNTDAGLNIWQGELPRLGPDDPESVLAVLIGDDVPRTEGGTVKTEVPFEVWALVPATLTNPLVSTEKIVADIRSAVEIEAEGSFDRYLGVLQPETVLNPTMVPRPATTQKGFRRGVTRGLRRPEGSEVVGAVCEYIATLEERWGESRPEET